MADTASHNQMNPNLDSPMLHVITSMIKPVPAHNFSFRVFMAVVLAVLDFLLNDKLLDLSVVTLEELGYGTAYGHKRMTLVVGSDDTHGLL